MHARPPFATLAAKDRAVQGWWYATHEGNPAAKTDVGCEGQADDRDARRHRGFRRRGSTHRRGRTRVCRTSIALPARGSAQGQTAAVERVRPEVAERLRRMNVLGEWLEEKTRARYKAQSMNTLQVCWVSSQDDADTIANQLADAIVQFVPPEFLQADNAFTRDTVRTPLAYVITELLDNSLTHGRGKGFAQASVWIAAQYYSAGDLIRLAVVDNGCGFLKSLESHPAVVPKSHSVAVRKGFDAGVSCNKEVALFTDALNAGIGLTISRDIAIRSGGIVWAGSGDAYIGDPGRETETIGRIPYWQGSMLNIELHRRGLIAFNFRDLFSKYERGAAHPGIRFLF